RVNAERVIARNDDLAANVSAERVEIVGNAEDADDIVVLVDPHERGVSSKLRNTSATEVVPVNPEQLPGN
ncbi:hypothetical protein, partial [Natronococcus sp.]|uniref:hypothetical protein n=1 Tax=Natronococcus sp. TaxID=35747 RepID=UPI003A4D3D55